MITFEEWLKENWQDDKNRKIESQNIDKLRRELKADIVKIVEERSEYDYCCCDTCIAISLNKRRWENSLMAVAIMYLLGENFNGAAALYYHSYNEQMIKQSKEDRNDNI